MKTRPILFSAPMVRALLDGRKTQTRRVVNPPPPAHVVNFCTYHNPEGNGLAHFAFDPVDRVLQEWFAACPYGQPGDQLWVRETYFAFGRWETRFNDKKGRDEWHFVDITQECGRQYGYPATGPRGVAHKRDSGITPTWWERPSIFMPRAASRITLEVTGVRVERLQDISEADAVAEGASQHPDGPWHAYRSLWTLINGPGSWDKNPWVWVVELKRITE